MILFKAFSADLFPLKCGLRSQSDVANTLKCDSIDMFFYYYLSRDDKPQKKKQQKQKRKKALVHGRLRFDKIERQRFRIADSPLIFNIFFTTVYHSRA